MVLVTQEEARNELSNKTTGEAEAPFLDFPEEVVPSNLFPPRFSNKSGKHPVELLDVDAWV